MTRVAVCLLTCNRESYTERTLESFSRHNGGDDRFLLLHGDDGSDTGENVQLAKAHGFQTIVRNRARRGWMASRMKLFAPASRLAEWVLFLENDIETLRPFPWPLFDYVAKRPHVFCLRLYGRFKDRSKTDACLTTHKRRDHKPVAWRPFRGAPEGSQIGEIHWSAQPAVTRVKELLFHHKTGQEPEGFTVRVKKNAMAHFGVERTAPVLEIAQEATA